jgi:hypothetical protein
MTLLDEGADRIDQLIESVLSALIQSTPSLWRIWSMLFWLII